MSRTTLYTLQVYNPHAQLGYSQHVGGLLGGYLGDKAAVKYPNHGRIFVVQISVITGPIFSLWLFKVSGSETFRDVCIAAHCTCVHAARRGDICILVCRVCR